MGIAPRFVVILTIGGALALLPFFGCRKDSNLGPFWTQRASSRERITSGFADAARGVLAAIDNERKNLSEQDQEFRNSESAVWKARDDAARRMQTRADRDLYWRLDGYAQKVSLMRTLAENQAGTAYLPALRAQVESCGEELLNARAAEPIKNLDPLPLADEPCTMQIKRSK